jgi:hypothetical protein
MEQFTKDRKDVLWDKSQRFNARMKLDTDDIRKTR